MSRTRPARRMTPGSPERLDERVVPSNVPLITDLPIATQETFVTRRAGTDLGAVFTEFVNYEKTGAHGTFIPPQASTTYILGNSVGVNLQYSTSGNFNTLVSQLKGIGMKVTSTLPQYRLVEGYLPISQLPIVAANSYANSISPVYKPALSGGGGGSTSSDVTLVANRGGQALGQLYSQFLSYSGSGTFTTTLSKTIMVQGTSVGVDLVFNGSGDFNTQIAQLQGVGMKITATNAKLGIVEGYLPISELPAIARDGYISNIAPIYKPIIR